jgi:hypothetical protein
LRVRLFQLATEPLARRTNQGIAVSHHDEHPAHDSAMISLERAAEIEHVIHRVTPWAAGRNDIIGLLLVGSCARNAARPDSDIDLVVLTRDTTRYADSAWADELAIGELIRIRSWGPSPNNDSPRPAASKSRSTSAVPTGRASGRRPRHSPRRDRRSPHPAWPYEDAGHPAARLPELAVVPSVGRSTPGWIEVTVAIHCGHWTITSSAWKALTADVHFRGIHPIVLEVPIRNPQAKSA